MRAVLLVLCALFGLTLSMPSQAEWTRIVDSFDGQTVYYIDYATVEKADGYVYAWSLRDVKPGVMPNEIRSMKVYEQYSCDIPRKSRWLLVHFYKSSMGEGDAASTVRDVQEWVYHLPDTLADAFLKNVCAFARAVLK